MTTRRLIQSAAAFGVAGSFPQGAFVQAFGAIKIGNGIFRIHLVAGAALAANFSCRLP